MKDGYIKEKMDQSRQKMEEGYPLESISRLDHAEYHAIMNNIELKDEFYRLQDKTYLEACEIYSTRAKKSLDEGKVTEASMSISIYETIASAYKTIAPASSQDASDEINEMKKKILGMKSRGQDKTD